MTDLATAIRERRLTPDIFLWVNDIDSVYGQHRANHAEITEELTTRPGGRGNTLFVNRMDTV